MKKIKLLFTCFLFTAIGVLSSQENKEKNILVKNLSFNTEFSDFGGTVFRDSILFFASSKNTNRFVKRKWKPNMQPFLDLYSVNFKSDKQNIRVKLNKTINTRNHESSVSFNSDYTVMYFTRNGEKKDYVNSKTDKELIKLKLYKADLINNEWSNVKELPINNELYSYGHPSINSRETKLYFISDMPGGYGETDIYSVDILPNGRYSSPKNLGPKVNTSGKEMFPFIDENNILYYSSNGFKDSIKDLDIYYYILDEKDHSPTNAGVQINSSSDDFAFKKIKGKNEGFFSSNRNGGKGGDDIYLYKGDFIVHPKKCFQEIEIIVKDEDSKETISAAYIDFLYDTEKENNILRSNENGVVNLKKECDGSDVNFLISKLGYLKRKGEFSFLEGSKSITYLLKKDITQDNRVKIIGNGLQIIIGNVFFDLNKDTIRSDTALKLNELIQIMNDYPSIKVEIGSHSDSRGRDVYNLKLSNRRSVSIKNYIISKGISSERIIDKGYGETQLLNECSNGVKCEESKHQLNRRTEFKIIKKAM
ncbi:MAG: OmpA family protein [Polaribacter sp.]